MAEKTKEIKQEIKLNAAPEAVPVQPEKTPEAQTDEWDVMVDMFVEHFTQGEMQNEFICINDRVFNVPRNGKVQKLPRPVADVLQEKIQRMHAEEERILQMRQQDDIRLR